jgi:hypothetical protein
MKSSAASYFENVTPCYVAQAAALFGSGISDVVLEKAFGLSEKAVEHIKSKFAS